MCYTYLSAFDAGLWQLFGYSSTRSERKVFATLNPGKSRSSLRAKNRLFWVSSFVETRKDSFFATISKCQTHASKNHTKIAQKLRTTTHLLLLLSTSISNARKFFALNIENPIRLLAVGSVVIVDILNWIVTSSNTYTFTFKVFCYFNRSRHEW